MTAGEFLLVEGSPLADRGTQIGSAEGFVRLWQRDEKDVLRLLQAPSLGQLFANGPQEGPRPRQEEREAEAGHLAQAHQGASATQAEANEQAT